VAYQCDKPHKRHFHEENKDMQSLLPLFGLAIVLLILGFVVRFVMSGRDKKQDSYPYPEEPAPYQKEPALFTPAEQAFLTVLDEALEGRSRVFGQVRLEDLIKVKSGLSNSARQGARNRIQSKHVDFVVCDPTDLSVQFVIELDDSSHQRPRRQKRDDFLDKALAAAGVRLLRFRAKRGYSVQDIRQAIVGKSEAVDTPSP
jgi:very-short-patch-repair endonuclease